MKQIPASLLTLTAGVLITLVSLWVGQHNGLMPVQASEQAPLIDGFFNTMVTIGMALFLVVQGAIVLFTIRYRRPPGDDTDGVPVEGNFSLEVFWTAIPALIVIGLGVYSVEVYQRMGGFDPAGTMAMASHHHPTHVAKAGSAMAAPMSAEHELMPAGAIASAPPVYGFGATPAEKGKNPAVTVNVTGLQFAWLFNYPDSGITSGELHIPVGADVQLNLSAQDVIHSFWVPQFRLKQDAMPGEHTELRFVATRVGTYPVVCTELCGSYHGGMRTQVVVHPPEEFQQWLEQNRIAQVADLQQAVALKPAELPESEFLAPYAQEMGITPGALAQLHAVH